MGSAFEMQSHGSTTMLGQESSRGNVPLVTRFALVSCFSRYSWQCSTEFYDSSTGARDAGGRMLYLQTRLLVHLRHPRRRSPAASDDWSVTRRWDRQGKDEEGELTQETRGLEREAIQSRGHEAAATAVVDEMPRDACLYHGIYKAKKRFCTRDLSR